MTGSGFDECRRNTRADGASHPGTTLATAPYRAEADVIQGTSAKIAVTILTPHEGARPPAPWGILGPRTPPTLGVHAMDRNDFWDDNTDVIHVPSVGYITFYALVSPGAVTAYGLQLPGMTGTYGAEACGSTRTGVLHNWSCDPTTWWRDPTGKDISPRDSRTLGPGPDGRGVLIDTRIGDTYNMRDVDCYDQTVQALRGTPVNGDLPFWARDYVSSTVRSETPRDQAQCDMEP
jgi:hypothetical protein